MTLSMMSVTSQARSMRATCSWVSSIAEGVRRERDQAARDQHPAGPPAAERQHQEHPGRHEEQHVEGPLVEPEDPNAAPEGPP